MVDFLNKCFLFLNFIEEYHCELICMNKKILFFLFFGWFFNMKKNFFWIIWFYRRKYHRELKNRENLTWTSGFRLVILDPPLNSGRILIPAGIKFCVTWPKFFLFFGYKMVQRLHHCTYLVLNTTSRDYILYTTIKGNLHYTKSQRVVLHI